MDNTSKVISVMEFVWLSIHRIPLPDDVNNGISRQYQEPRAIATGIERDTTSTRKIVRIMKT